MKRHGRATSLGAELGGVVGKLDRRSGGGFSSTRASVAWAKIAGPLVSAHTTGAHLRDGKLVVYVDNPAWAMELTAMAEQYRASLNEEIGEDLVKVVSFSVSKKVAQEHAFIAREGEVEAFYREDDVEPVALTQVERAQVEASAESIPDEALREAAVRATVKDMEWKKGLARRNGR